MIIRRTLAAFFIALHIGANGLAILSPSSAAQPAETPSTTTGPANAPPSVPLEIDLPPACIVVSPGRVVDGAFEWSLDCGPLANVAARATLGRVLEEQGWTFCESGLAAARWWKNGITTTVLESEGASSPFRVIQRGGQNGCP